MSHPSAKKKSVVSDPRAGQQRGFTLMELIVTMAVAAILVAIAAPSFASIFNANRLSGTANELLATLQSARIEAIRRNARTVVCRSDDGASCNTANGDWGGWISYIDTDSSGSFNAGDVLLRTNIVAAPVIVTASPAVSGASSQVVFRADGMAHAADGTLLVATIGVCIPTTDPQQNARDVSIATGSRVSVALRDGGGACAAPAN
jgi:type IV fimbrial biogenesis protein FimT